MSVARQLIRVQDDFGALDGREVVLARGHLEFLAAHATGLLALDLDAVSIAAGL